VIIADNLTEEQEREFIIKDNVWFWEWDYDLLANEWDSEELEGWGLDINLWDDIDFDSIESNEDRENTKKEQNIICPECEHSFTI
jgi:hypothetical protein